MDEKSVSIPHGFIIDLYRYLNTSPSDHEAMEKFYKGNEAEFYELFGKREIAYGNYDRIQLRPVDRFDDYAMKAGRTYQWIGTSQSILIFSIEEAENRILGWQKDKDQSLRVRNSSGGFDRMHGFMAASFCYISNEARSCCNDYKRLLLICKNKIHELIDAYNKQFVKIDAAGNTMADRYRGNVQAEVFGSFCSAEIVVMWSAEQYTDILYLIDCVRDLNIVREENLDYPLFRATYTTISYPDRIKKDHDESGYELAELAGGECGDYCENNILGEAFVHMGLQEGISVKKIESVMEFIRDSLKEAAGKIGDKTEEPLYEVYNSAGEYDLIFKTKSKYLTRLFHKPDGETSGDGDAVNHIANNLNIHNSAFNKLILHTSTRLCYTMEDLPDFVQEWIRKVQSPGRKNEA